MAFPTNTKYTLLINVTMNLQKYFKIYADHKRWQFIDYHYDDEKKKTNILSLWIPIRIYGPWSDF